MVRCFPFLLNPEAEARFRCIEALARAGEYEKPLLNKAIAMFEVRRAFSAVPAVLTLGLGLPAIHQSCRAVH